MRERDPIRLNRITREVILFSLILTAKRDPAGCGLCSIADKGTFGFDLPCGSASNSRGSAQHATLKHRKCYGARRENETA
jgi:hypothetical protein